LNVDTGQPIVSQYVASALQRLADTRAGGFVLTRQQAERSASADCYFR
jgi:hypothetical protein